MRTCLDLAERQYDLVLCPLLFSFAYRKSCTDLWSYLSREHLVLDHLMIDSGAPTVRSQGIYIDRDEYGQFIQWVQENPLVNQVTPVSLDVIPRDRSETEKCAQASLENFLYLKKCRVNSLPVYHYGEHRKWLDRILEQTNHIGLGGMAKLLQKRQRLEWLDGVWEYLMKQNIKGLKVHGFAQTSPSTMQRYSWYSVDSASAVISAAMGRVYLPKFYCANRCFSLLAGTKMLAGHASLLDGLVKDEINAYLNSIGFNYRDLFDHYKRIAINVRFFMNFVEEIKQ